LVGKESRSSPSDRRVRAGKKLKILHRFQPYENGALAHDRLSDGRHFVTRDARAFRRYFAAWAEALTNTYPWAVAIGGMRAMAGLA
jgi:hypothetical protein